MLWTISFRLKAPSLMGILVVMLTNSISLTAHKLLGLLIVLWSNSFSLRVQKFDWIVGSVVD